MPIYVVYGSAAFSSATRRNHVVRRATDAAAAYSLAPSSRIPGIAAGVLSYTYTVPLNDTGGDPSPVPGESYAAMSCAYEHADRAIIDRAAAEIASELAIQGWLFGRFGTWTDLNA